jgi:phosphoglycolate phosphatase
MLYVNVKNNTKRMQKLPTLFFDLDGTLIDSRGDIANSVNLTRADYGLPPLPIETISTMVGNGAKQLMLRAMPGFEDQIDEIVANNRQQYANHLVKYTYVYPGVKEGLAELRAMGCKMAVTSNKTSCLIPQILETLDILKYFDVTVGGGDVPVLKPDPGLLYLAAKKMNVEIQPTDWVIGDHYTDLEVGRHAGIHVCHCSYGFGNPRNETFNIQVDRLEAFAAHLKTCL